MHGMVEGKIQQIKKSITRALNNYRLSVMQWETLGSQIANSINNLPTGLSNKTEKIENLYQYGIVQSINKSSDGRVRTIEVEYQNHTEKIKRKV